MEHKEIPGVLTDRYKTSSSLPQAAVARAGKLVVYAYSPVKELQKLRALSKASGESQGKSAR
jgi:hypothetical protein